MHTHHIFFHSLSRFTIPELFIASLRPASLDENIFNLPIQNISNMFTDQVQFQILITIYRLIFDDLTWISHQNLYLDKDSKAVLLFLLY